MDRNTFQDMLALANPQWQAFAAEMERTNSKLRTNPDGDVAIEHLGVTYQDFIVPDCRSCAAAGHRNAVHKPEVVFFGETISPEIKARSYEDIEAGDKLLLIGTTLATYSAFRLVKHALELKKPVMLLNTGPTRADTLPGLEKIDINAGQVLTNVAKATLGARLKADPALQRMLSSGVVQPPPMDDDSAPRAAG